MLNLWKCNNVNIMPENSNSIMWSEIPSNRHFNHSSSTGLNVYSWAIKPFREQISGSFNLSRIDKCTTICEVHPYISNENPATILTIVLGINMINYISGMCGKAW